MEKIKAFFITAFSAIFSWLGVLAVPVFLLVGCNIIDYVTGLLAAKYRDEAVSSYKGIRGIIKKVCMWLLIGVGWMMDTLLKYTVTTVGLTVELPFIVATVVAVWLICNELISILENMIDIGVSIPPFLMPLVKRIKNQVEEKTDTAVNEEDDQHE